MSGKKDSNFEVTLVWTGDDVNWVLDQKWKNGVEAYSTLTSDQTEQVLIFVQENYNQMVGIGSEQILEACLELNYIDVEGNIINQLEIA